MRTPGSSTLPVCARLRTRWERCSSSIWPILRDWWRAASILRPCPTRNLVTTTTHKTLRGPRAGLILCQQQYAAAVDKAVFPGQQGGPLVHVDRRQGRGLSRGAGAGIQAIRAAGGGQCPGPGGNSDGGRLPRHLRWNRHPSPAGRRVFARHPGQRSQFALQKPASP